MCLAALVLAGCQVYDPSLVERDAGQTGGQCDGRRPPPRPTGPDGPDAEDVLFGLRDVVLDQAEGSLWAGLGYNLDGYCTGAPDFGRECEPASGDPRSSIDGEDGIDNVFGKELFPLVEAVVPGLEDSSRDLQVQGRGLVVVRIREWNGLADDPQVHVTITQSVDSVAAPAAAPVPDVEIVDFVARLPGGEEAPPPLWDGNDYTWVRDDTFLSGDFDEPLVFDGNAYIAGDTFVVRLPDRVEILFQGIDVGVVVRITGGVATGRITADRMGVEDVVVAGRWSMLDLLRTAENVGVCEGSTEYNVLRSRLEAFVDVSSSTTPDPGVECDAISVGVGFTGVRLRFGGVTEGPPLTNNCDLAPDGGMPGSDAGTDAGPPDAGVSVDSGP